MPAYGTKNNPAVKEEPTLSGIIDNDITGTWVSKLKSDMNNLRADTYTFNKNGSGTLIRTTKQGNVWSSDEFEWRIDNNKLVTIKKCGEGLKCVGRPLVLEKIKERGKITQLKIDNVFVYYRQ